MNVRSPESNQKVRSTPKGKKDPRLLRCFYCGILGHVKAGCPVRIYRRERAEKRRAREEGYQDGKEKNTLSDIRAMTVTRKRLLDAIAKSTEMLSQELERWCSGKEAEMDG
jgi:hypothetical protein